MGEGDKEDFGKILKSHAPEQQTRLFEHDSDEATSSTVQKWIIFLKGSSSSETQLDILSQQKIAVSVSCMQRYKSALK